jgi:hypothetical protein
MRSAQRTMLVGLLSLAISALMAPLAQAHLMVAQHGTLNIVDDGAFMVLSLPISAFEGLDDDSDGSISMVEFNNHRSAIVASVRQHITLSDKQGNCLLQGIMLSPVAPHGVTQESLSQLTVMGRYALNDAASALRFHFGLYGKQAAEQKMKITATRNHDKRKAVFRLAPVAADALIFTGNG